MEGDVPDVSLKCIFGGQGTVGKTSMLLTLRDGQFPNPDNLPIYVDTFTHTLDFEDRFHVSLELVDTQCWGEGLVDLFPLCFPETDVFCLCVSMIDPLSVNFLRETLLPIIKLRAFGEKSPDKYYSDLDEIPPPSAPDAKLFLVGTKMDMVNDPDVLKSLREDDCFRDIEDERRRPLTMDDLESLREEFGFDAVAVTSSRTQHHFRDIFETIMRLGLEKKGLVESRNAGTDCCVVQ